MSPRGNVALAAAAALIGGATVCSVLAPPAYKAHAVVGVVQSATERGAIQPIASDQLALDSVRRRIRDRLDARTSESVSDALISQILSTLPGAKPGTLEIVATDANAEKAASIANIAASAIVANQDEVARRLQRQREAKDAAALAALRGQVSVARDRLASLGTQPTDSAQVLAAAKVRATNARARVATIHAIMAAGSPPLSDRSDVPPRIKTLQKAYVDLAQQLGRLRGGDEASAQGKALAAQTKDTAERLTTEWRRLGQAADAEVTRSRAQLDALAQAGTELADPLQVEAQAAARRDLRTAEDALAEAQRRPAVPAARETAFRIVSAASAANATSGMSLVVRVLIAGFAGLLVLAACFRLTTRRSQATASPVATASAAPSRAMSPAKATSTKQDRSNLSAAFVSAAARNSTPAVVVLQSQLPGLVEAAKLVEAPEQAKEAPVVAPEAEKSAELPGPAPLTTIMVAANEMHARTTPVALAIGRAAAAEGIRVLIVETARPVPTLASATESIDPVIVDLNGALCVALPADQDGLYLVPSLTGSQRIAAELTRRGDTKIIDEMSDAFDLMVIDGGCAAESAADWKADVYLRVGATQSRMADALFAATFDIPLTSLLDTVLVEEPAPIDDEADDLDEENDLDHVDDSDRVDESDEDDDLEDALDEETPDEQVEAGWASATILALKPQMHPRHIVAQHRSAARHPVYARR